MSLIVRIFLLTILLPGLAVSLTAQSTASAPATAPPSDALRLYVHLEEAAVRFYWFPKQADDFARWHDAGYRLERRQLAPTAEASWTELGGGPITVAPRVVFQASEYPFAEELARVAYQPTGERWSFRNPGLEGAELIDFQNGRRQVMFYTALGTMSSWDMAQAMGYGFRDDAITPGAVYEYRLTPGGAEEAARELVVRTGRATYLPRLEDVRAEWGDRTVELSWRNLGLAYYGAQIYRRPAGQDEWTPLVDGRKLDAESLNERTVFTDSLPDNETDYEYAIRGLGRLGFDGPLDVDARGRGSSTPYPPQPIIEVADDENGRFLISWDFLEDADTALVDFFTIHRGVTPTGGLSLVSTALEPGVRSYRDEIVADQVWYTVTAHRRAGTKTPSVRQHVIADDTIPPPPVEGLRGEIDLDGVVSITWNPSSAEDAIGYRVWFSNGADRAGTRLTDTLEVLNTFTDTLDLTTVNDTVFYRVSALDERENVGDWSVPLALPIPDILPPAPPRLRTFTADTSGVRFTYARSSSDDVVRYEFQRRARYTDYWQTFARPELPAREVTSLRDSTGAEDITYEYRLIAFDERDLRGVSNVLIAKREVRKLYPAVGDLEATARPESLDIQLTWVYPEDTLIESFRIYRAARGGDLRTYRTIRADALDRRRSRRADRPAQWRFSDEDIRRDTGYTYAVRAIYRTGAESRAGTAVQVEF